MHEDIPEPIGNLDWGDFVTDIMEGMPPDHDDFALPMQNTMAYLTH